MKDVFIYDRFWVLEVLLDDWIFVAALFHCLTSMWLYCFRKVGEGSSNYLCCSSWIGPCTIHIRVVNPDLWLRKQIINTKMWRTSCDRDAPWTAPHHAALEVFSHLDDTRSEISGSLFVIFSLQIFVHDICDHGNEHTFDNVVGDFGPSTLASKNEKLSVAVVQGSDKKK